MKFGLKEYQIRKTRAYLKNKNLFFILNGANKNIKNEGIPCEQKLKEFDFSQYKIYNRTSVNVFKNSIFNNVYICIHGIMFFMESIYAMYEEAAKENMLSNFIDVSLIFIGIKINDKIYSSMQTTLLNSFRYNQTKTLFFHFILNSLKIIKSE